MISELWLLILVSQSQFLMLSSGESSGAQGPGAT